VIVEKQIPKTALTEQTEFEKMSRLRDKDDEYRRKIQDIDKSLRKLRKGMR
jgi:hypothetical protein